MSRKVLIVGGVAGGASAAAKLRRMDEEAQIILFEKGEYISFANCGLPYHIGEVIKEEEKLVVVTPERMKERFNIDVRTKNVVTKINPKLKTVDVYNIDKEKTYQESYDKLILSPGAMPIKPPFPGVESEKIFTLRNIPDTYKIKSHVDSNSVKRAVVVGGGYIGLEVAENLIERGISVTVIELADHVVGPLDYDMATNIHHHLEAKGVELYLKDGVKSFDDKGENIEVTLSSGKKITSDMVVLGIGVRPDIEFIKDSGLEIGETGGIKVDKNMKTSDDNIYAVGDAVEVTEYITNTKALIPLAGPANKQGRVAACHICGIDEEYTATQGTAILKVFDISVGVTGVNERILQKNGIKYQKSFTFSVSHASYYPGATPIAMKLIFDPEKGTIYGSQMVGYTGIDKRIDVIATAIRAGLTVFDLEKLELSYAPPYSSAKDPVNIAGFVAVNIIKGDVNIFHWHDIEKIDRTKSVLLDVRTKDEFDMGSIEGSVNIDLDNLRDRLSEIPKDKKIYVFCQVGLRGYLAYRILVQNGYKEVYNLSGGYKIYDLIHNKQSNEDIYENEKIEKNDDGTPTRIISNTETYHNCGIVEEIKVDATGMQCPGPIIQVYKTLNEINFGQVVSVKATDPGFKSDIKTWCERTGNALLSLTEEHGTYIAKIKKEKVVENKNDQVKNNKSKNNKSIVVFSNDFDKALATFIIANGAAAMGRQVTLFFTFWGLNLLRKGEKIKVKKDILAKMFGMMMPRGSSKVSLSKMHMGGMGTRLMKYIMKKKNVNTLEELMQQARDNGVKIIACNMSMDIMGIKKEELIDGIDFGGVASFVGSAEESDMSLFI